jgi:hypothetical protein
MVTAYPAGSWTTARTQEDGPVTWEALVSPRETPAYRGAGESPRARGAPSGRRPLRG